MVTLSVRVYELNMLFNALRDYPTISDADKGLLLLKLYKVMPNGYFKNLAKVDLIRKGVLLQKKVKKLAVK